MGSGEEEGGDPDSRDTVDMDMDDSRDAVLLGGGYEG